MRGANKFLVSTTMLAVAACGGQQAKLEIRSTPTQLAKRQQPVPQRIAEARGQLAIGNVGLALESFRIAARENPNSTDALLGIASCYDQMGRFDLSRRSYEAALAIAPADTNLLAAFAGSLQLQGRIDEALAVRQEIALRAAAASALATATPDDVQQVAEAPVQAPAVVPAAQAPIAPVEVAAVPELELPARSWDNPQVNLAANEPGKVSVAPPQIEMARVEINAASPPAVAVAKPAVPMAETAAVGRSVSVKLPPARRVQPTPVQLAAFAAPTPVALAPVAPAKPAPVREMPAPTPALPPLKERTFGAVAQPTFVEERGPRLERVSMGEIALVTVPRPVWQAKAIAKTERSATLRFVPLREAYTTVPVKVRLLNAARVDRLAARTRGWLMARGWRGMAIGNADAVRSRSVVLYPADKRWLAQRLAGQFGFALAPRSSAGQITVLLGSDAARHPALRRNQG